MTLSRIQKNSFLFERLQFFFSPTSDSLSPKDFVETKKTSSFERKPLICFGVSPRQLNRFSTTTLQLPSKINFTTFKFFLLCNLIFSLLLLWSKFQLRRSERKKKKKLKGASFREKAASRTLESFLIFATRSCTCVARRSSWPSTSLTSSLTSSADICSSFTSQKPPVAH